MTVQFLEQQAAKAERLARTVLDKAASDALTKYASDCRAKAKLFDRQRDVEEIGQACG